MNKRFLLKKKNYNANKTRRFSDDVLSLVHDCGQVCFPSLSTFFNLGKFRWKVGSRSWLHARCIARDTALHLLRMKKIKFDFEIVYFTTSSTPKIWMSFQNFEWVFKFWGSVRVKRHDFFKHQGFSVEFALNSDILKH